MHPIQTTAESLDITFNLANGEKLAVDPSLNPFKQGEDAQEATSSSGRNSLNGPKTKGNKRAKWGLLSDGGPTSLSQRYETF